MTNSDVFTTLCLHGSAEKNGHDLETEILAVLFPPHNIPGSGNITSACAVLNIEARKIYRNSNCGLLRNEAMQATATPEYGKTIVSSPARPRVRKRRSANWDGSPRTGCTLEKGASPLSPTAGNELSEAAAIQRAQGGDEAGFEYLYRLHSRRVYALCLRMVGNTAEAEDLTQEAFLVLLRKIHTFRGESAFSTWLHRLTVNLALMRLRKKSPPIVSMELTADPGDETGSASIDIGAPNLLLEGSLDRINLERCIKRLPVGYRTIFVLHDIQGYEHREIAEILGRSVGDSKSQLHKARTRMREQLHELQRDKARDGRLAAAKMRSRSNEASLL
jgi:RNA polymerase sigma-70 factor, ECF subfamily